MKNLRIRFLLFLYQISQKHYRKIFKRKKRKWQFTEEQLLYFQADSLGRTLGEFYKKHGFRMIPQMENHDVYHLITEYGTSMKEEIALQFLLFGNGKRSAYLLGTITLGTFILPEYFRMYYKAYRKGKAMREFHHWDYEALLWQNFSRLKDFILQKETPVFY